MEDDMSPIGDKFITKEFCDLNHRIPKQGIRRQTRHAASHVDFRADCDPDRNPEDENPRRKRRSKPQHCPSCHCQSMNDNSTGSRPNDTLRRKNTEKVEATLNQHLDYSTAKTAHSAVKNSLGRVGSSSPRARIAQQRSQQQYHRSGASAHYCQDCDNLGNSTVQQHYSGKHGNVEEPECPRGDSQLRNIVNSDVATEDTDFRLPYEQTDFRKFCKESNFRWNSPPGEPHLELETDDQRRRDNSQSKRWHSGQGESVHDDFRVDEIKPWIETESTDARDNWQYNRDQQELRELCEGVRQFAKRKSAGWNKQREQTERDESSQETLEKINRLVSKLPAARQGNTRRAATRTSLERRQPRNKSPIEQSRIRTSKFDRCKSYHSSPMDARTGASNRDQEVGKNVDDALSDIELESFLRVNGNKEEEETKEDETASETEEEARQLAINETEIDRLERQMKKNWNVWRLGEKKGNTREISEFEEEKDEKNCGKLTLQRKTTNPRERSKGKKEKEVKIFEASKQLSVPEQYCYVESDSASVTYEDECMDEKKINSRERSGVNKETKNTIYEESKHNRYRTYCRSKDLELEMSKTKTCIDEMIDSGLNREIKRGSAGTLRETKKDFQYDVEVLKQVPFKRGTSDEASKIKRDERVSHTFARQSERVPIEHVHGDCFYDSQHSRKYARELKNRRWAYLNHMRNDLGKLFDLEKCLDSCSPERHSSLPTVTTGINAESKETNRPAEKKDKVKERVSMQSSL